MVVLLGEKSSLCLELWMPLCHYTAQTSPSGPPGLTTNDSVTNILKLDRARASNTLLQGYWHLFGLVSAHAKSDIKYFYNHPWLNEWMNKWMSGLGFLLLPFCRVVWWCLSAIILPGHTLPNYLIWEQGLSFSALWGTILWTTAQVSLYSITANMLRVQVIDFGVRMLPQLINRRDLFKMNHTLFYVSTL